jgi:thioredoxin reductase
MIQILGRQVLEVLARFAAEPGDSEDLRLQKTLVLYLLEASVPGIFAAGNVRYGSVKRVASAVGEGAVSVSLMHQYLKTL